MNQYFNRQQGLRGNRIAVIKKKSDQWPDFLPPNTVEIDLEEIGLEDTPTGAALELLADFFAGRGGWCDIYRHSFEKELTDCWFGDQNPIDAVPAVIEQLVSDGFLNKGGTNDSLLQIGPAFVELMRRSKDALVET